MQNINMWIGVGLIALISIGWGVYIWQSSYRYKLTWKKMSQEMKEASARLMIELIKADGVASMAERSVIDFIPSAVMQKASKKSFEEALETVANSDSTMEKKSIVTIGNWIVKADDHEAAKEKEALKSIETKLDI